MAPATRDVWTSVREVEVEGVAGGLAGWRPAAEDSSDEEDAAPDAPRTPAEATTAGRAGAPPSSAPAASHAVPPHPHAAYHGHHVPYASGYMAARAFPGVAAAVGAGLGGVPLAAAAIPPDAVPPPAGIAAAVPTAGTAHGTVPASVMSSPEHVAAYAEYCKRTLGNAVNGGLLTKRDALCHTMARLQQRMEEVRAAKANAERELRSEVEEGLERLRAAESFKMLLLQREMDELARHVDAIQRLAEEVGGAITGSEPPLEFLGRYRALYDACERLAGRPHREEIDVSADDLTAPAARRAEEAPALERLLAVKDQMIWSLLEERKALQTELQDMSAKYDAELEAVNKQCEAFASLLAAAGVAPPSPPEPDSPEPDSPES